MTRLQLYLRLYPLLWRASESRILRRVPPRFWIWLAFWFLRRCERQRGLRLWYFWCEQMWEPKR